MRVAYHTEGCIGLILAMVENAISDYKNVCMSGYLSEPFQLRNGALSELQANRTKKRCCMLENATAKDLLAFLSSNSLDRLLSLAGTQICGDRVRSELVKFYHKHNGLLQTSIANQ